MVEITASLKTPPPLPRDTLTKVLRVSGINGWSIALIAGAATVVTVLMGDWFGSAVGVLVTAAGAIEINGNRLLRSGSPRGCRHLMASQLLLLSVLWVYCLIQLASSNQMEIIASLPVEAQRLLYSAGLTQAVLEPLFRLIRVAVYGGVMLATTIHQGGLFRFYHRCARAVAAALQEQAR